MMSGSRCQYLRNVSLALIAGCLALSAAGHAAAPGDPISRNGETYVLSVHDMEIAQDVDTDDTWDPAPDLVVRVSRTDPDVNREIQRLQDTQSRMETRTGEVRRLRNELLDQKKESERERVEPLTDVQAERLKALFEEVGSVCSASSGVCDACPGGEDFDTCTECAKRQEQLLLRWMKMEGGQKLVEPLTDAQAERLKALFDEVGYVCSESTRDCDACPGGADFDTCHACAKCEELRLLLWRKQGSEKKLVEPLTEAQVERLKALFQEVAESRRVCRACGGADFDTCYACAKCEELRLLEWRKEESVPVPPLTEAQQRQLDDYEEEVSTLGEEMEVIEGRISSLRKLLSGASREISTHSLVVDFRGSDVIRVYPGDQISVSVWDNDLFNDDLYGRTKVTLDRATLERGTLDLSMPNIKLLRLGFRRDESTSAAE